MFYDMFIAISAIFFIHFGTKLVNFYFNFYHIYKYLDSYQKLNYFKKNDIILFLSKSKNFKNIIIYYLLIPIIKINYLIISLFTSVLYTLCEDDFNNFLFKRGINQELTETTETTEIPETSKVDTNISTDILNNTESNSLFINHNYIHNITKDYDNDIEKTLSIQNEYHNKNINTKIMNLPDSPNSSNLSSSSNLPDSSNTPDSCNSPEYEIKSDSVNNLNLHNEFGIINKKNKITFNNILKKNYDNSDSDNSNNSLNNKDKLDNITNLSDSDKDSLDNYIISNKLNINNIDVDIDGKTTQTIETIKIDDIDFGQNVNNMFEKYKKEGKIVSFNEKSIAQSNISGSHNSNINSSSTIEIKIGKKKK